jgi:flagellin FlaB
MDSSKRFDLNYSSEVINTSASGNNTTQYTAIAVRDEDSSFTNTTPVLNSGDLIEIQVSSVAVNGIKLDPRKTFWLSLNQELGQAVNLEIATPNSFGVNRYVRLYP